MPRHSTPVTATAHVPEVITKELALIRAANHRKVRISTNFLPLMGFEFGCRHTREVLPDGQGLRLAFDPAGPQKVYQRRYPSRRNNPFETVVEIANQDVLAAAIPGCTERIHVTMRAGEILIRPLVNRTFAIRRDLARSVDPFSAMVAMTSGIDISVLRACGFNVSSVLEYRPHERRDTRDLTETGMLTVLANAPGVRYAFNEDIPTVDWRRVADIMASGPRVAVLHISLTCDDYSQAKSASLKARSRADMSTTTDLVYDALRAVEVFAPAAVMLEQVPGFAHSHEGALFATRLRRWGYFVTEQIMRACDYGGRTQRERLYSVASVYPGFGMPRPTPARQTRLWDDIEPFLAGCSDVSDSKAVRAGIETGRARLITPATVHARTILKSQQRAAKDSLYVAMPDGRYLLPSVDLLRYLSGISPEFDFGSVAMEQCVEQIGQGIDVPLHAAVCTALHAHLAANIGRHSVLPITRSVDMPRQVARHPRSCAAQLDLFGAE